MARPSVQIRPLAASDLSQVQEIEKRSFPNAWSFRQLHRFLRCQGVSAFAAVAGAAVLGFAFVERSGADANLLNLAVHPDHRRTGIGRRLVDAVLEQARAKRLRKLRLEVRETNVPAQIFYRTVGFRATRILKGHYRDSLEDGYRMECPLDEPVGAAAPASDGE
jgi:ribosomal-protein-alanine N-acetyltransferase